MDVACKDRIVIKHLRRVGTREIVHVWPTSTYRLTVNPTLAGMRSQLKLALISRRGTSRRGWPG